MTTIDNALRNGIRNACLALRQAIDSPFGWDTQGTDANVIQLLQKQPDPALAFEQAIHWSGYTNARTPAVIHDPEVQAKVAGVTPLPAPKPPVTSPSGTPNTQNRAQSYATVHCGHHGDGATIRSTDGVHSCCWSMRAAGEPDDQCCVCAGRPLCDFCRKAS